MAFLEAHATPTSCRFDHDGKPEAAGNLFRLFPVLENSRPWNNRYASLNRQLTCAVLQSELFERLCGWAHEENTSSL